MERVKTAESYKRDPDMRYNEIIATLTDGRTMTVNTQYGCVEPWANCGGHKPTCSHITVMGGRCDCGLLDDIDVAALVDDARVFVHAEYEAEKARQAAEDAKPIDCTEYCERCGKVIDPATAYGQMENMMGVRVKTYYCGDCHELLSTIGAGEYTALEEAAE